MPRLLPTALLTCLAALALAGCSYVPTTRLDYAPLGAPAQPRPASLAVIPLADERPPRMYPAAGGVMFLTYVPLVPYVEIPYERLDQSLQIGRREVGDDLPDDELFPSKMARAMADDLARSGLFREVTFVPSGASPSSDYVLRGTLRSTRFDLNATSYMLGMAGVLLWLAPLPIGSNTADVAIDLELVDRAGQVVWHHALQGHGRKVFTLYNSGGAPITNRMRLEITRYGSNDKGIDPDSLWACHAEALRAGMGDAKASLAAFLAGAPPP
ncbi:MAG: hypothetical protein U0802_03025 [Candidatus Binatia bacterium]